MQIIRKIKLKDGSVYEDYDGEVEDRCPYHGWDGNPETDPQHECIECHPELFKDEESN